jgi:glycosyltransferase involved in cell wall biosynthesis
MTICIYAPMKNEVGNVPDWVESGRQIADQLIILDTGSTDGTIEEAKKHDVDLHLSEHFNKDTKLGDFQFHTARNEALDQSRASWNIAMDADERLIVNVPNLKEKLLQVPRNIDLLLCPVHMLNDAGKVTMDFMGERIFRNNKAIRYEGAMHNYVNVPQNKRQRVDWITVTSCRNKRSREARTERHKQRILMAETAFLPKIKKNPNDTRSMFYLARTYKEDSQAEKAIYWFRKYLEKGTWSSEVYQAAYELSSLLTFKMKELDEAFDLMVTNIRRNYRRAEGYVLLGDICYAKENWDQAAWWYEIATKCEEFQENLFLVKNNYTWLPWDKLGMSYHHQKKYGQAARASQKALQYPDLPERQRTRIETNIKHFTNASSKNIKVVDNKIEQGRVSRAINFFEEPFHKTLGLKKYYDPEKPAIFYGCYPNVKDAECILKHKSLAIVVWCGSDAFWFTEEKHRPEEFYPLLTAKQIKHVATSEFICNDLRKVNLPYRYLPIVVTDTSPFKPVPKGDKVYVYANKDNPWLYGDPIIKQVEALLPDIEFIKRESPLSEEEKKENVVDFYKKCFVGLRPTVHDGICHTAVEMGLMGRKLIWNGSLPNAVHWHSAEDIVKNIKKEQQLIGTTDAILAQDVEDHLKLPDDWLTTEFWD